MTNQPGGHHTVKFKLWCPVMEEYTIGTKYKKYCSLCKGFLGEKRHQDYQKKKEGYAVKVTRTYFA